ncbi:MAG: hypothetical protein AAF327_20700 [Cyanobacteria bacterium P01_A01_bin.37]
MSHCSAQAIASFVFPWPLLGLGSHDFSGDAIAILRERSPVPGDCLELAASSASASGARQSAATVQGRSLDPFATQPT